MTIERSKRCTRVPSWVVLALILAAPAGTADEPLGLEEVVRMTVSGTPDAEIIALIQDRPVDFDLSEEMVSELRLAGVSDAVIAAMRARQRAQDAAASPPPAAEQEPTGGGPDAGAPALVLHLVGQKRDENGGGVLRIPASIAPAVAEQLGIGSRPEDRAVTGAAWYVACVTATHVPDHWRSKSPLGRDFVLTPRHRMLKFAAEFEGPAPPESGTKKKTKPELNVFGFTPGGGGPGGGIELRLEDRARIELDIGLAHDLVAGVAIEVGGRYYNAVASEPFVVRLEDADVDRWIELDASGGPGSGPAVRVLDTAPPPS